MNIEQKMNKLGPWTYLSKIDNGNLHKEYSNLLWYKGGNIINKRTNQNWANTWTELLIVAREVLKEKDK